jgi:hypothetical protein
MARDPVLTSDHAIVAGEDRLLGRGREVPASGGAGTTIDQLHRRRRARPRLRGR